MRLFLHSVSKPSRTAWPIELDPLSLAGEGGKWKGPGVFISINVQNPVGALGNWNVKSILFTIKDYYLARIWIVSERKFKDLNRGWIARISSEIPMCWNFWDLHKQTSNLYEKDLEQGLINHLRNFARAGPGLFFCRPTKTDFFWWWTLLSWSGILQLYPKMFCDYWLKSW